MDDKSKVLFQMSICNDTLFLSMINVLDYSILVGIDEEKMELVVGIIDYMRQYDIMKQMERVGEAFWCGDGKTKANNYTNSFAQLNALLSKSMTTA